MKKRTLTRKSCIVISVCTIIILFFVWWLCTDCLGLVKPLWFPTIGSVFNAIGILKIQLLYHALATLMRVVVSWLLGSLIGVSIGLIIFNSKLMHSILNPVIEILRPIPAVCLIPLVIVWMGIEDSGKILITGLACMMIMIVNSFVACGNVAPVYVQAAESMGATRKKIFLHIYLPAIIPEIISGARIGIATACGTVVACEYMGATYGIGYLIMTASRTLMTNNIILGIVIIGLEAFLLERILHLVSSKVTRWKE